MNEYTDTHAGPTPRGTMTPRKRSYQATRKLVAEALAHETTPARLSELASDPEIAIRDAAASNPNMPAERLNLLASDVSWSVRRGVATNPAAPEYLLVLLARDGWEEVRREVAANRRTPVEILEYLYQDPYSSVRRALYDNPNTPAHIRRNPFEGLQRVDDPNDTDDDD